MTIGKTKVLSDISKRNYNFLYNATVEIQKNGDSRINENGGV